MSIKKCSQCENPLPISDFWRDCTSKDGRKSYCKDCGANYMFGKVLSPEDKARYATNRKDKRKNNKEYREKWLADLRNYRNKNNEKTLLSQAKYRARKRGLEFNIDLSDIVIPDNCPLTGIPIVRGMGKKKGWSSPSLDRVDITKGYIKGNVAVISDLANTMKNSATLEELLEFAKNIPEYVEKYST